MLTISNQIRELKPDSWYNFKPEDTSIVFDTNKRYGVDEDNSYIFNSVTPNYLVPRWNKPVESFTGVDEDYTSNQLAESEFLMENDASLMCGRNKSKMAGLLVHETTDEIETLDDVLRKIDSGEQRQYLFQFRGSSNTTDFNYISFNYDHDGNEYFVPLVYDSNSLDSSFAVTETYTNTAGDYEIWGAEFKPAVLEPDGFGTPQDMRDLTFKLVNPKTGKTVGNSKTYMFIRNGSLTDLNSEKIPNPFENFDMYRQQQYLPGNSDNAKHLSIVVKKGGQYYRMKDQEGDLKLSIPKVDEVYFVVKTPYLLSSRSYEFGENLTNVNSQDYFMEFLGFRFFYRLSDRAIRLFNIDRQSFESATFSAAANDTILFFIKTSYEKLAEHDPVNGKFHYKLVLKMRTVNRSSEITFERVYKGGIKNFKYKGLVDVSSIPSFDSAVFQIGNMPQNTYVRKNEELRTKEISCRIAIDGQYNNVLVPEKIIHRSPYAISAVDNFCFFINRDIESEIEKLYITQYREDESLLDRSLIQYWPMDSLRPENLRSGPNSINSGTGNTYYNLYGYMGYNGVGKVHTEKVDHSVVKACTFFDGQVTGNSNNFSSWSNNNNYTMNFWFKSNQKSRGVILCDMDKESIVTAGIYIGVSDSGTLEVAFNTRSTRIYNNNITDNEWHMISLVISERREYLLYLDAKLIDTIIPTTGAVNKSYTTNYQIYFMGHPLGKNVKGYLSRIGFYGTRIDSTRLFEIYQGDVEHRIYGTILASNMPFETEIRFYDYRTGRYLNSSYSSSETGKFIYRNYDGMDVHLLVVNNNHKYGTIQVMGPLTPSSVEN